MPLYEYRCKQCARVFEVIQKFADPPLTVHEECGGEVERLLSAPAFHFKGSGFYITDYGGKKGGKSEGSGASSENKSDSKPDSKSDSKSDSKPATPAPAAAKSDSSTKSSS